MGYNQSDLVNRAALQQIRDLLGADFLQTVGHYRDDSAKNVVAIENAYRANDAVGMVRPAHTLKGDSLQFGAEALGMLAEHIEHVARQCVEEHRSPSSLGVDIPRLRPMLTETLAGFQRELAAMAASGMQVRRPVAGFGRKQVG